MSPRKLALAALLACRPVSPASDPPAAPPPAADPATPPDPGLTATAPPEPGLTATAPPDPGVLATTRIGATLDPAAEIQRVAAWDGPPNLLVYRPGPGGWPDLPGRAVGVLWSVALYAGRDECATRNPNDPVQYQFARGLHPTYSLYFPSDSRGFNFLPQWIVPLPDGTTTRVDAAMFRPDTANPWGLHACAHLVELAVNAGRGGRGLHFVANDVRVLDGTVAFPWHLDRVLADLRARFLAHADEHRADLAFRRAGDGPWTERQTPGLYVTWIPESEQLEVLLWRSATRTATRTLARETVTATPCPPGAPCMRRDVGTFETREVLRETVDFAVRFELDRAARLVRSTIYAPRQQTSEGRERVQVHN